MVYLHWPYSYRTAIDCYKQAQLVFADNCTKDVGASETVDHLAAMEAKRQLDS